MASTAASPILPLDGIRVLDLSRLLPGPFASQMLVDLGAEVIKIEDRQGDYARYSPPLAADGNSAFFHSVNRGKKSVLLDLKVPRDQLLFRELLKTADVLIEGFRPGVMTKLGFELTELHRQQPKLIICSISGFGQTGPDALRAGHDLNYLAKAGILGLMKEPAVLPVQVADLAGGAFPAVIQILAAVIRRGRTGEGALIDVAMCENTVPLAMIAHSQTSLSPEPIDSGNTVLTGSSVCYAVYPTSDGFISVGALEPAYWINLCKNLNCSELIPYQYTNTRADYEFAYEKLKSIFLLKSSLEWKNYFSQYDLMVEIIENTKEIYNQQNQHFNERDVFINIPIQSVKKLNNGEINQPTAAVIQFGSTKPNAATSNDSESTVSSSLRLPRMPLRMSGISPVLQSGPQLGQHNNEILGQLQIQREIQSKL